MSAELVLFVLLPGLVFDAAFDLEWTALRSVMPAIVALAVPGVLASTVVVALVLLLAGLPWQLAFVVGAITAATDPVAVVATLKRQKMPLRLRTLIEAESLLNDGTGLVLFALAVTAATTGMDATDGALLFGITIVVSVAAGVAAGLVGALVVRASRVPAMAFVGSIVLAYGAYALAAMVGISGVLATVVTAITLGNVLRRSWSDEVFARTLDRWWSGVALVLSACAFGAIGIAIDIAALVRVLPAIAAGVAGTTLARAAMVYVPLLFARRRELVGWAHVLFWSGLRGAVAFAAALGLPASLPNRVELESIAFGIVLVTLIGQGVTAPLVVRAALPRDAEEV